MKILHVSPMYSPALGGAEHHLQAISEGLVSRGHSVTVFTANVKNPWDSWRSRYGELPKSEIINGVNVVRFHPEGGFLAKTLDKWLRLKGGWRSADYIFGHEGLEFLSLGPRTLAMIPQILRCNADIVTSMNWYWPPAYHTYLARRIRRFAFVGIPLFHTAQPWCRRAIYRRMLASCDAIIVNTSYEGRFVEGRTASRVEVVGVGVHPQAFERRNGLEIRARYGLASFPVVGFVGRQDPNKGILELINGMRRVWEWNTDVRLVIAGPGSPYNKDVKAVVDGLSVTQKERVVHIGPFDETEKGSIFDAFDVLALPSKEESFGIAYLEAWACRKPVIGARTGPIRCVVDEGIDGLLVDPDDADDIARAIIELLSDSNMRERMGRSGHAKTVTHYTWDKIIDRVERLYVDLVAVRAANRPWLMIPKRSSSQI